MGWPPRQQVLECPLTVSTDTDGNLYVVEYFSRSILFIPQANGTYFGRSMTANYIYIIAGRGGTYSTGLAATSAMLDYPYGIAVDSEGNFMFTMNSGGLYRNSERAFDSFRKRMERILAKP